jgi:hypothetical protein
LTVKVELHRANVTPRLPESPRKLPPVEAPTLGIWSSNDHYLHGERMKMSGRFVKGLWRYEQIEDASHWIPLDAPDRLNQLLIEWLGSSQLSSQPSFEIKARQGSRLRNRRSGAATLGDSYQPIPQ